MGMFTALGEALAKYKPELLMEHLKLFWGMCLSRTLSDIV